MPLFGSKKTVPQTTTTTNTHSPTRSSGLFGNKRSSVVEPVPAQRSSGLFGNKRNSHVEPTTTSNHGGLLNRHHEETVATNGNAHHSSGGLLNRHHEDRSIVAARERVIGAEKAEHDADRALIAARQAVKAAREHVKNLEREAKEEV